MVLIGQKCHREGKRRVQKEEGRELAVRLHCPFFEVSGRERINITEAVRELVREILKAERR